MGGWAEHRHRRVWANMATNRNAVVCPPILHTIPAPVRPRPQNHYQGPRIARVRRHCIVLQAGGGHNRPITIISSGCMIFKSSGGSSDSSSRIRIRIRGCDRSMSRSSRRGRRRLRSRSRRSSTSTSTNTSNSSNSSSRTSGTVVRQELGGSSSSSSSSGSSSSRSSRSGRSSSSSSMNSGSNSSRSSSSHPATDYTRSAPSWQHRFAQCLRSFRSTLYYPPPLVRQFLACPLCNFEPGRSVSIQCASVLGRGWGGGGGR